MTAQEFAEDLLSLIFDVPASKRKAQRRKVKEALDQLTPLEAAAVGAYMREYVEDHNISYLLRTLSDWL